MPDAKNGQMKQGKWTLSVTPGTVLSIQLPDNATGFRIRPQGTAGQSVIFAIGEDPAAEGAAAFAVGNVAVVGEAPEVRLPSTGTTDNSGKLRELRMRSATASLVVIVDTF